MFDEPWKACGTNLCLTQTEVQSTLSNKVEIGLWMAKANALFNYYEGQYLPVTPGAITPSKKSLKKK